MYSQPPNRVTDPCVAHCDADRFYFAVEAIERPELAQGDRAVIVGHDPRSAPRAIVTTANDAARALGINSGMPGSRALRLAPDAIFVAPRFDLYRSYSERLMQVLRAASPVVQQLSIDEAWLDWRHVGFDEAAARALRGRALDEVGLSISVGVATSKLVSKMATEMAKPGGVRVVLPGEETAFLAPLPVRALYGVGPRTAERLVQEGIITIGAIAQRSIDELMGMLGKSHGEYLWQSAQGIDRSELVTEREPKSFSAEHTFQQDTLDRKALWAVLREQATELSTRLVDDELLAGEVAVKLRYSDFQTLTRQTRLRTPTNRADHLATAGASLMREHWDRARPIRLIGLRAARFSTVSAPVQLALGLEPEP